MENVATLTEDQQQKARWAQMERAEQARGIYARIESRIWDLQLLTNNEYMNRKVFRLLLDTNEDIKKRYDILNRRQFNIRRFIWNNA